MFDRLDLMAIGARQRAERYLEKLMREEKGASDFVAILIIIVILLGVAATFKDGLKNVISAAFSKATSWIDGQTVN